jgi:hypothetical protein
VVVCTEPALNPWIPVRANSAFTIALHARRISNPPRPRIDAPVPITSDNLGFVDVQSASAGASLTSPVKIEILIPFPVPEPPPVPAASC